MTDVDINRQARHPHLLSSLLFLFLFFIFTVPSDATADTEVRLTVMVPVEGGCFEMGDRSGKGQDDERPVHEVCVSDFSISATEVTKGEFAEFVKATGYRTAAEMGSGCNYRKRFRVRRDKEKNWQRPGFAQAPEHPVVCVSSEDALAYIKWRTERDGTSYRLPTEAEWEYAARGGDRRGVSGYVWAGTSEEGKLGDYALYRDNSRKGTRHVARRKPNALGLFDISGNVWEWTSDFYDDDYYGRSPKDDPKGPATGEEVSARGGSWSGKARYVRIANRMAADRSVGNNTIGFRLAVSAK